MTAPRDDQNMTCEEFHKLMPELIGSGDDIHLHPHIQSCELCRAFLADLEAIRDAARELFPAVEPPDDLWSSIESKIKEEDSDPPGEGGDLPRKLAAASDGEEP
jgi:hypothetical protein